MAAYDVRISDWSSDVCSFELSSGFFREEYYHASKKPYDGSEKFEKWLDMAHRIDGRAEVIVAKQRHGSTGIVPMMFHNQTTKFSDAVDDGYLPAQYE